MRKEITQLLYLAHSHSTFDSSFTSLGCRSTPQPIWFELIITIKLRSLNACIFIRYRNHWIGELQYKWKMLWNSIEGIGLKMFECRKEIGEFTKQMLSNALIKTRIEETNHQTNQLKEVNSWSNTVLLAISIHRERSTIIDMIRFRD